ncbi:hypothetical protein LCGC14_2834090 [marine sediment metagenome]|uniref:Uncharacterized protein n=1 Tax=marine sediment metagenome TaxID=412755 RepID=A0A0F8YZW9_9ZZZZ
MKYRWALLVYREWVEESDGQKYSCEGWWLFGLIPTMINKYLVKDEEY